MKIVVNHEKCSGHARCFAAAADFFVLDDDGYNRMPPTDVPKALAEAARKGARACPERAITVVEEEAPG